MGNNRNIPTDEDIELMIQYYFEGMNTVEIGEKLKFSYRTVWDRLEKTGVLIRKKTEITPEIIQSIINLYEDGLSSRIVAKKLDITKSTVLKYLKENNIKRSKPSSYRKYTNDSTFFDSIDTSEKAYWLGVLFADGYNRTQDNSITLGNAEKDKDLPYGLKKALKATNPIYIRKRGEEKHQDFYTLKIYDKQLSQSLNKLGCCQNKTDKLQYPDIPKEFNRDFIRGYFDGDGSIWNYNDRKFISITGYIPFLESIRDILTSETELNGTKISERKKNYGDIRYGGKLPPKLFADYIYYKDCICLKRKFDKLNKQE